MIKKHLLIIVLFSIFLGQQAQATKPVIDYDKPVFQLAFDSFKYKIPPSVSMIQMGGKVIEGSIELPQAYWQEDQILDYRLNFEVDLSVNHAIIKKKYLKNKHQLKDWMDEWVFPEHQLLTLVVDLQDGIEQPTLCIYRDDRVKSKGHDQGYVLMVELNEYQVKQYLDIDINPNYTPVKTED